VRRRRQRVSSGGGCRRRCGCNEAERKGRCGGYYRHGRD
jgi:hypothetical protein